MASSIMERTEENRENRGNRGNKKVGESAKGKAAAVRSASGAKSGQETTAKSGKKSVAKSGKGTGKTLLIVESPSKAKTIGKYLGSTYKVVASVGHIRDLPKSKLGIDIKNDFEPEYIPIRGKGDLIKELKKDAKQAGKIYLATDPDREGEAISWHLAYILGLDEKSPCRVVFNEITKEKIKAAVKAPRAIDLGLVDAQQARRVLDRLVGYQISPLLWRKIKPGLSAGRVQSAALKIICDREREIMNFVPKEYWNINVLFKAEKEFSAKLSEEDGKKLEITDGEQARDIVNSLERGTYKVSSVTRKERSRKPFAPFTTSSLQQDAANKLGFTTKRTMSVVQQLYEGIDIKGEGTVGLVTYIRTDSVRVSDEARAAAKEFIEKYYGEEYTANNVYANKKKDIQDAHEAIRPSRIHMDPESIKDSLTKEQYSLYKLIWTRFMASQMSAAKFDTVQVGIENGRYGLKASGSRVIFDGYQKLYSHSFEEDDDKYLPELKVGQILKGEEIRSEQKFTEPPARFTEASLVKELEEKNIGRPSTYAPIVTTLLDRRYAERQKKSLAPTELGFVVTDLMEKYFNEIVDVGFTADMEDRLDDVEGKDFPWKSVVRDFYGTLETELAVADKEIEKVKLEDRLSDQVCELCGQPMAFKMGRFGEFLACIGYPECKNTKPIVKTIDVKCPDCGGDIVAKKGKSGKIFYGCANYPKCTKAFWYKPVNRKCPECGSLLLERSTKNIKCSCSNDKCGYKEYKNKDDE